MKPRNGHFWTKLDNAGKLFASSSDSRDPMVFRFICALKQDVDPAVLQQALDATLKEFPIFRCVLRRGLFWYYFEDSTIEATVSPEAIFPCSALYDRIRKTLLFRVSYYGARINLEMYHALTDGTGAIQFLRTLVYNYLRIKIGGSLENGFPTLDFDASRYQRVADSFDRNYTGKRSKAKILLPQAFRMSGAKLTDGRFRIISGQTSVKAVLGAAHSCNTTISVFITAALICAIHGEMPLRERSKPVTITIPVNLRNYFESASVRNFFGTFNVSFCSREPARLEDVIPVIAAQFEKELTQQALEVRMQAMTAIEHNPFARIAPLALKDYAIRKAHDLSERGVSACVSNLGRIEMPKELEQYIDLFDVFISAKRLQLCMCSYNDKLLLGVTSPYLSTDIQKRFFRFLTSLGLPVLIRSNLIDGVDVASADSAASRRNRKKKAKQKPPTA